MAYIDCMTKKELLAESHEAGNYIHKNVCFNMGTGIEGIEVSIQLYDKK